MRNYIQVKKTESGWTEPSGWIDINTVANNEILLLVTEGTGVGFNVKVGTGTGTFSIDWGDSITETALVGNGTTVFQHQHTTGGTPCSLGYNTWKIRIYNATENITGWNVAFHTYTVNLQKSPILSANIGAKYITSHANMFYKVGGTVTCNILSKCKIGGFDNSTSTANMFNYCTNLSSVTLPDTWGTVATVLSMFSYCQFLSTVTLPSSWGNVATTQTMFNFCSALSSIALPASWGNVTNVTGMFTSCNLKTVTLPTSWGNVTTLVDMFTNCSCLIKTTLPNTWGIVSSIYEMFNGCSSLYSITLPPSWGNVTNANSAFSYCSALKTIENLNFLGSITAQSDFASILLSCEFLQQAIVVGSLLSKIAINGASGKLLKCTSIRLTNSGSTFTGSSPQVNVSYTSLDVVALNLLFGDLPTLVGKTINITGCPGAATCTRTIATAKGWTVTG